MRKQQNHQERVQHILRHAAQVFRERGYEGASIRQISRSSGVALSSLYYYCRSKQELLYRIEILAFTQILDRLEARLAAARDPGERLRVLVRNHLEYFLEHPDQMKVMAHEEESLAGAYRKEVAEIKRRYYRKALEVFEGLGGKGGVRRVSPRVAVLSLFGMMNWVYTWHRAQIDPAAGELAEMISNLFLEGVRPEAIPPAAGGNGRRLRRLAPVRAGAARANS